MEALGSVCRICLNSISDHNYVDNRECINGKIEAIFCGMHMQLLDRSVLCGECSQLLDDAYNFKYNCLKVEETVLLKVSKIKSDLKLDLVDIMLWTDNTPKPLKNSFENICRTCLRLYEKKYELLDTNVLNLLKICVPEVDINLTLSPDICEICTKMLYKWDHLRMVYLNTENLLKRYCSTFHVNSESVDINRLSRFIKSLDWKPTSNLSNSGLIGYNSFSEACEIKFECTESNVQIFAETDSITKIECTNEFFDDCKLIIHENVETVLKPMKRNGIQMYICPKCKKIVKNIEQHIDEHGKNQFKFSYQCHKCDYRNKSKSNLREHLLSHKQGNPEKLYACDQCSFQSKQKGNLMTHLLVHKKPEEIKMYKCHLCKFQARQKGNLKTHFLTHKKPEEINMFKCNICSYQARQKGNLQTHILKKHKHFDDKILEEALFYKCKHCSYKAKQKPSLAKHMLTHKS